MPRTALTSYPTEPHGSCYPESWEASSLQGWSRASPAVWSYFLTKPPRSSSQVKNYRYKTTLCFPSTLSAPPNQRVLPPWSYVHGPFVTKLWNLTHSELFTPSQQSASSGCAQSLKLGCEHLWCVPPPLCALRACVIWLPDSPGPWQNSHRSQTGD